MTAECLARFNKINLTYLFHLHTHYTDGLPSVRDYFAFAKSQGIAKVIFLEHIRKDPKFDVGKFVDDIRQCSDLFEIEGVVGFEAKILPGGELDIRDEHISLAEFIGIAEHHFPLDESHLVDAFGHILDKYLPRWNEKKFVWVHPGLWFQRQGTLDSEAYEDMFQLALQSRVALECNFRYSLPNKVGHNWPSEKVIAGLDAHSLEDVRRFYGEMLRGIYER